MRFANGFRTNAFHAGFSGLYRRAAISASRSILAAAIALPLALAFPACTSDSPPRATGPGGPGASVELRLVPAPLAKTSAGTRAAEARPTDSAHVRVSGPGMDTLAFAFSSGGETLALTNLPPGVERRFEVRLFSARRLLYAGVAVADLASDRGNTVQIALLPEFSRLTASIHVSPDFPKVVAGGALRLWNATDTLTANPVASGELRHFRLEEVPGDGMYAVSIALWDPSGDTLAKAFKPDLHVPKGENVALVLPLEFAYSQLALVMTVGEPGRTTVVLSLPGGRRAPAQFGDAVFSEFYPVPTAEDGGDATGEWLELFNRAADTLELGGCQIVRDAGTSPGMLFNMPSETMLAPGRALVLGRSGVEFANVSIGSSALSLTNSSARLELRCAAGTVLLDSLRYSTSASDSVAARIVAGKVTTLLPSRLSTRHASDAWCLASPHGTTGEFPATPGRIAGGCGE